MYTRNWDSTLTGTTDIYTNNLFDRLLETNAGDFKTHLKQRWDLLRSDVVTNSKILLYFQQNSDLLIQSQCIKRENERWDLTLDIEREYEYIESWTIKRMTFLDEYFSGL